MSQNGNADHDAPRAEGLRGVCVGTETARAKVNLTLEVLGRRPDGYHELRSLVAFAVYGDTLMLDDASAPFSLRIDGPFAGALEGGNLIQAAAGLYARFEAESETRDARRKASGRPDDPRGTSTRHDSAAAVDTGAGQGGQPPLPPDNAETVPQGMASEPRHPITEGAAVQPRGAFRLTKRLPVAAGLGGGSADAAAALRLLAASSCGAEAMRALLPCAATLGADVPVCLLSKPAMMTGIGERLSVLPVFPKIPAVLVNPRKPLATAAVFRALQAAPRSETTGADDDEPTSFASLDAVLDYAARRRNDLEAPARRLMPEVGEILSRLERASGAVLARLSGSGPTCFALFRTQDEALAAARSLRTDHPGWWIEATALG